MISVFLFLLMCLVQADGRAHASTSVVKASHRHLLEEAVDTSEGSDPDFDSRDRQHEEMVRGVVEASHLYPETVNFSVVYTWVNGTDQELVTGLQSALHTMNVPLRRIRDRDELFFSLRSLERNMPWYTGPIYIVTNRLAPVWLDLTNPRVHVVSHHDIWTDPDTLPTANSAAIELHLHRIPGIGARILYLNDDFFIGRPVALDEFWDPQGRPRVRPTARVKDKPNREKSPSKVWRESVYNTNDKARALVGQADHFFTRHAPYPILAKAVEEVWARFPEAAASTVRSRTRSIDDLRATLLIAWVQSDLGWTAASYADQDQAFSHQFPDGNTDPRTPWLLEHALDWTSPAFELDRTRDENDYNFVKLRKRGPNSELPEMQRKTTEIRAQLPKFINIADYPDTSGVVKLVSDLMNELYPDSSGLELFKPEDQWSSYDGSDDLVDLLATVQSDAQKHRLRGSHQQS